LDATSAIVHWMPTMPGNYSIVLRALDEEDVGTTVSFVLPVASMNHPPQFISVPFDDAVIGVPWTYRVLANDPDGDALTIKLTAPIDGFSIDANNVITWTPTTATNENEPITITVVATDGNGGETTDEIDLNAVELPNNQGRPIITSVPSGPAILGQTWSYQLRVLDLDSDGPLSYFIDPSTTAPITINNATGLVNWTPGSGTVGNYTVALRVVGTPTLPLSSRVTIQSFP